jgi:hypothetical protein
MLFGNAAERPRGFEHAHVVLGGESFVALAEGLQNARECQSGVIEPMRQRDAGNRDAERGRIAPRARSSAQSASGDGGMKPWAAFV